MGGDTLFLCRCPLKDGKWFNTNSGFQKQNGRESFHKRVKSTFKFDPFNMRLINIVIYIFQDLKRDDAKTSAWGKFSRLEWRNLLLQPAFVLYVQQSYYNVILQKVIERYILCSFYRCVI